MSEKAQGRLVVAVVALAVWGVAGWLFSLYLLSTEKREPEPIVFRCTEAEPIHATPPR